MLLVDTSIWIDHFNEGVSGLAEQLSRGAVIGHRWILGELLMGSGIPPRQLQLLRQIDMAATLPDEVLLQAIDEYRWRGLSWVDLQLVLSANAGGHALWTRDRAAQRAGRDLGLAVVTD